MTRGAPAAKRPPSSVRGAGLPAVRRLRQPRPARLSLHPWHEAWTQFAHIPYLSLGVAERQTGWQTSSSTFRSRSFLRVDRQANRTVAGAIGLLRRRGRVHADLPPRTVSLNDIVAEVIGSAMGSRSGGPPAKSFRLWRVVEVGGPLRRSRRANALPARLSGDQLLSVRFRRLLGRALGEAHSASRRMADCASVLRLRHALCGQARLRGARGRAARRPGGNAIARGPGHLRGPAGRAPWVRHRER